jgi:xylulokinase
MAQGHTDENGEGHVFGSPAGGYMTLICFKNGSLAREKIREHYKIADWKKFGALVESAPVGNNGGILLPWFEVEIVPRVTKPGVRRFNLDEKNVAANCRAIFEAQALSLKLHSQWMGVEPAEIFATGGAASNPQLLQIIADVMQCPVKRIEVSKSAALGAALAAAHGCLAASGKGASWEKICAGFTKPVPGSEVTPDKRAGKIYAELLDKFAGCELDALDG